MKVVSTKNAPSAIGPYSQAIKSNGFVFTSGQIGLNTNGELLSGIEAQTKQVLANLKAVLEEANSGFDCVLKTTIFLVDMNDFALVNEIYGAAFGEHKPARSTVAVASLPKGALVEIECVAVKK